MKPPKRIKVGPHRYKVVDDTTGLAANVALVRGSCHHEHLTIALDATLPHTVKAETLLHEVIHACLDGASLEDGTEETVCRTLGGSLLAALRDNPDLVRFLTA